MDDGQPRLFDLDTEPPASGTTDPADVDDRRRIERQLDTTMFVEAGAGAGKTTALVGRVARLVATGVDIRSIAPITFTEKAAAELRHRLRGALAELDSEAGRAAGGHLDHAPIGTLHAFARRILDDFSIEAGVPPGFTVLDQLESDLRFESEWVEHLDRLLADPTPDGGIADGGSEFAQIVDVDSFVLGRDLRQVADDFRHEWDLVDRHVDRSDPGGVSLRVDEVVDEARAIAATLTPPDDPQAERVALIGRLADAVDSAPSLALRVRSLVELGDRSRKVKNCGRQAEWKDHGGREALGDLRDREIALADLVDETMLRFRADRRRLVGAICGRFTVEAAERRVRAGTLEFHDLLVHTRRLLVDRVDVRRAVHQRYTHLLLDEFQDTDPIQLEIAVRIAADPDDPAHDSDWRSLVPLPGRLFIVGDPKQSIYRFRRADIAQYLRAAEQIGASPASLTANFRSSRPVIDFVNQLFSRVIVAEGEIQPPYRPLDVARAHHRDDGSVVLLGAEHHDDGDEPIRADELRRREAADVVGAISSALADGWEVSATPDGGDHGVPGRRACRPGDICVLIPARTSLPFLEDELRAAAIPYRAENASVVYGAPEIRELLLAIRAADDPTDELAAVSALRSPLYGCSDRDLLDWRRRGGGWSHLAPHPEGTVGHPVADALHHLRDVHRRLPTHGAADLLAAVADERRVFDVALSRHDGRDVWRRVRFVIDQARGWADAGGRGIRHYLEWARLQAAEGRMSESVLPEEDHDAVRIMTVHAAKGLEFPITILTGMTTRQQGRRGVRVVWNGDEWMLTGAGDDGGFDVFAPLDEQMSDSERRRLLYVACTRAVDHLVVSLHRTRSADELTAREGSSCTSAELLVKCGALEAPAVVAEPFEVDPADVSDRTTARAGAGDELRADVDPVGAIRASRDDVDQWSAELADVVGTASRRSAIAATRLADEVAIRRDLQADDDPGLDKYAVNIDLPPWQRGRYGTAIGRAVHGTLQFCDLADGHDIDPLARAQCAAEGVIGSHPTVAALARSALTAPIVRTCADGAEHRRELFIAAPVGDRLLEGYIDLLVRADDGLVIVDYKTDRWSGAAHAAERVSRYRTQLAAYAAALEATLGESVARGVLVHCVAGADAEQIEIADWRAAVDEVRRLVA